MPKLKLNQNQADAVIDFRYIAGSLGPIFDAFKSNDKTKILNAMTNYKAVNAPRRKKIKQRFNKK